MLNQIHVFDRMVMIFSRHILSNVGRVAARDSSRTSATVQDLFVALCEDDSIYGLFKTMKGPSNRHLRCCFPKSDQEMGLMNPIQFMNKLSNFPKLPNPDEASPSHEVTVRGRRHPIKICPRPRKLLLSHHNGRDCRQKRPQWLRWWCPLLP